MSARRRFLPVFGVRFSILNAFILLRQTEVMMGYVLSLAQAPLLLPDDHGGCAERVQTSCQSSLAIMV